MMSIQVILESPTPGCSDPWEKRKKYEEDLKEQLEYNRRLNEERRLKELEDEMKFEKRFLEQQEKIKREFEAEIARKKEKLRSVSVGEGPQERTGSGRLQETLKIPLVERTNSPPVPALREKVISKDFGFLNVP